MHSTKTSLGACAQKAVVNDAVAAAHFSLDWFNSTYGAPTMAKPIPPTTGAKKGTDAATPNVTAMLDLALPIAVECKKTLACNVDQTPVLQNTAMHSLLEFKIWYGGKTFSPCSSKNRVRAKTNFGGSLLGNLRLGSLVEEDVVDDAAAAAAAAVDVVVVSCWEDEGILLVSLAAVSAKAAKFVVASLSEL